MKRKLSQHLTRSTILFLVGIAGVIHETLLTGAERPTLLILFAAMIGLPAFLNPSQPSEFKKDDTEEERAEEQKEKD